MRQLTAVDDRATRWALIGALVMFVIFMLGLGASVVLADAPAPAAKPRPAARPSPSPTPVPFDMDTDPPGDLPPFTVVPAAPAEPAAAPVVVLTPIEKANARGFHMDSQIGALGTATSADGFEVSPFFWINTDGPLAIGNGRSFGRLGARIGLTTLPGRTLNALDVNTYNGLEADFWGGYVIGKLRDVETSLFVEGGFGSRMKGAVDPEPQRRLVRSFGGGVRFDARKSQAYVLGKLGFDEATASCQAVPGALPPNCYGFHSGLALMLRGQVPLYKNAMLFTGDVSLSIGGSASWLERRDVLRFGLALDPVETVKALKGQ